MMRPSWSAASSSPSRCKDRGTGNMYLARVWSGDGVRSTISLQGFPSAGVLLEVSALPLEAALAAVLRCRERCRFTLLHSICRPPTKILDCLPRASRWLLSCWIRSASQRRSLLLFNPHLLICFLNLFSL